MKSTPIIVRHFMVLAVGLSCALLSSCETWSMAFAPSRTRYLGSAREIVSCREAGGRVCVAWRSEHGNGLQSTVIDLRTRQVKETGGLPGKARVVPLVVLEEEASAVPAGAGRPCLGIWRVHPGQADSLWMPRVRWIDRHEDFVVNLPSYRVGMGDLGTQACLLPTAVAKDGIMTVAVAGAMVIPAICGYPVPFGLIEKWAEAAAKDPPHPEPTPVPAHPKADR